MTYILEKDRIDLHQTGRGPNCAGEINYILFSMLRSGDLSDVESLKKVIKSIPEDYLESKGMKYQTVNDIVGAVFCAVAEYHSRLETDTDFAAEQKQRVHKTSILASEMYDMASTFYRKVVRPYEDQKIAENGDVL